MDGTKTANEFARKDGMLRVRCVGHAVGRHPKSDAFIITLNDRVWLIDGGMRGNYDAYERLLDLREAWIGKKSREVDDETCKLHITCLISHFHVDHVQELVSHILKSPYIAVDEIVFPPETALRPEASRNEDYYYRNVIRETLAEYQPDTKVSVLRYGLSGVVHTEYDGLTLDILPPDSDWGTDKKLDLLTEIHFGGNAGGHSISIKSINSNSVWHLFRFGGKRLLFTGDSNKNDTERSDESVDLMAAEYSDILGGHIDVLKWPHHGCVRNAAAGFMHSMTPEYIVITTAELETASAEYTERYPDDEAKLMRLASEDIVFYVTADGNLTVRCCSDVFADFENGEEA